MKDRNELIRLVRQIIGDEKEDGFYTSLEYNNEIIQVPNYLFKDGTANYPEIRISPFLSDEATSHPIRVRRYDLDAKVKYHRAIFQIDIYATNIVLVNKIYSAIRKRIDLFYDIDTVWYGYDKSFKKIDIEKNIYFSPLYNAKKFTITSVNCCKKRFKRVYDKKYLGQKDVYCFDETGIYISTDLPIKMIRINNIINGLVFPDGETEHQKGIIKTHTQNKRMISELEKNNVERISFELGILYRMESLRNPGPIATGLYIDNDSD